MGINPFVTSKISVKKPSFQPPILKRFVAPMFFDPTSLGSSCLANFEINNPNGIEPTK